MKNVRIIVIFILCTCGILFGGTKIPNEVIESINKTSLKYPAEIRLDWKKNQIKAYRNINPEHFGVPETIILRGVSGAYYKSPRGISGRFLRAI